MKLKPLVSLLAAAFVAPAVLASTSGVVISQVYGGGGNGGALLKSDFVELFNAGSSAVNLKGWSIQYGSATGAFGSNSGQITRISDTNDLLLAPGRYLLIKGADGAGGTEVLPTPDVIGTIALGGSDGKIALVSNSTPLASASPSGSQVVDIVGYGSAGFFEGTGATAKLSATLAAIRAEAGCADSNDNKTDFAVGSPAPRNSAAPAIVCDSGGEPPVATAAKIYAIQGTGVESPLKGRLVSTGGVVTHVTGTGFYLQDLLGDGDNASSDGIFVYTAAANSAQVGQQLSLTATVTEFIAGASSPAAQARPITQLSNPSNIVVQGSGFAVPPLALDLSALGDDGLEAYEGMLVTLSGPLTVQQNFFLGRYGQLTMAAGDRLLQPTNLHRPGSPEALALAAANARRMFILDDNLSSQNPDPTPYLGEGNTVRAGDTTESLTGVIDFGLATASASGAAMYKLQPTLAAQFTRSNPRRAAPAASGGNIRVASANVLNYFTTFTNGQTAGGLSGQGCTQTNEQGVTTTTAANCRGASNLAEFNRQQAKLVASLSAINADVVGLMEIQNNGDAAAQNLADALNAQLGAMVYKVVPKGGLDTGGDAIRVAMLYKPGTLTLQGAALSDTHAVNNRPTFAQGFAASNGERFAVAVNHLKSKGSCPAGSGVDADQGDGQGCWNATRVEQAERLRDFVVQVQAAAGSQDVVLIGDLNAHGQEDPLHTLTGDGAIVDQVARFKPEAHTYVFDGLAGRMDHGLATASLTPKIVSAAPWNINADEPAIIDYNLEFKKPACASCGPDYYQPTPYKSSDHDPVVLGLNLVKNPTAGNDVINGTAGDDVLTGGLGRDTLTGGAGRDQFVYKTGSDGPDTITDFAPADDTLVFTELLQNVGISSANPLGEGFVTCSNSAAGALIGYDPDGAAGAARSRPVVTLKSVNCSAISAGNFKF